MKNFSPAFRVIAFILLAGSPFLGVSQQEVFSYIPGFDKNSKKQNGVSTYMIQYEAGQKNIFFLRSGNEQFELIQTSADFKLESSIRSQPNDLFKSALAAPVFQYMGGTGNSNGANFFFFIREKRGSIYTDIVWGVYADFNNKSVEYKMAFEFPAEERSVEWFADGGKFYLLNANNKANQLILYSIDETGNVGKIEKTINWEEFNNDNISVSDYFLASKVFTPKQQRILSDGARLAKFYVTPGQLKVLVSNEKDVPHIWTIDCKTLDFQRRKLDLSSFSGHDDKKLKPQYDLILYGGKIFVLNLVRSKIEVGVFDGETAALIKKHEILSESKDLPYIETPTKYKLRGMATRTWELSSTKRIISEVRGGTLIIAVSENESGNLILDCGTYSRNTYIPSSTRSVGGFRHGTTVVGQTTTGGVTPIYRPSVTFDPNLYQSTRQGRSTLLIEKVQFKILLDSASFDIVKNKPKQSLYEKVVNYPLNENAGAVQVFSKENIFYKSYYDTKENSFRILEFK